jgi:pimeloyl-ACP methyl ester carboxylesterase
MSNYTISFAHANGFPAGSYDTFFSYFPDNMNIIALEKYGHSNTKPVNNNWQAQVEELIEHVEKNSIDGQKFICLGHSFGGVISFLACCQRPDLFNALIMLDPPVLSGAPAFAARLLKKTPWIDKYSPAGKAKNRQKKWPLNTDIHAAFAQRTLFKNFDSRCLNDYIKHGIITGNKQLELAFDAGIEASIFRSIPTNLSHYKNKLKVPGILVYGNQTTVFPHYTFENFAKLNPKINIRTTQGGHMFPLESPKQTAKLIIKLIEELT